MGECADRVNEYLEVTDQTLFGLASPFDLVDAGAPSSLSHPPTLVLGTSACMTAKFAVGARCVGGCCAM